MICSEKLIPYYKRLKKAQREVQTRKDKRAFIREQLEACEDQLADLSRSIVDYKQAGQVIDAIALELQNTAQAKISAVVSNCLRVFGDYSFRIEFAAKRKSTAATFILSKDGMDIDPMDCGGGVIDVIAFALRVSVLMARKPQARPILFLDEPFKFVSANYRPIVGDLMEELANELEIQFVIVTHIPELMRGKVVSL